MKTIQTVLLRKDCSLGLDTQNQTFRGLCPWQMRGLLCYFNFQEKTAKLAQICTCCALSDVYRHLLHISKHLLGLFMCLSPQAYFKGLGRL